MAKKSKKRSFDDLFATFGTAVTFIGVVVAIAGVWLADLYNQRQERNRKLQQISGSAIAAVAKCQGECATLSSNAAWPEIKPIADREKWVQIVATGLARVNEARKTVCKDGASDIEACQMVADTVREEMAGLSDHIEDVLSASADRAGAKASLSKDLSEGRTLLRQAEKLLGDGASFQEMADRTLVATIKKDLALLPAAKDLPFSDLYLTRRSAARSAERLRWLVERLTSEKTVVADEWVVRVVYSEPTYMATMVRYTWDNTKDSPVISNTETTREVGKDVFEIVRSSNGEKIADTNRPGQLKHQRVSDEVSTVLGLPALAEEAYPFSDNEGEIYLEDCSEALKVTLQFQFKGQSVERAAIIYKADLGPLFPLTLGDSFVLKGRNASTDNVKIPVWLAKTWSEVYNQRGTMEGGI